MKPYTVLILTILTVACQINAPFNVIGNTSMLKRKILDAQATPYNQQETTVYEKDDYTKIVYEKVDYDDLFADEKSRGDTQSPRDDQSWKGFERVAFKIGKHDAYYVKPTKALEGKPWVWRASFPDWHTDMDSILLTKGFHVVFVQVDDQYGSPYSMQIWDKTYNYLTDSCSFAPKVALEGVSRGGLYVYGWAKRNPDKVACIYNEAPVCDIKSWPGGKGKGAGNKDNWAQLLQVFKMTEAEALAFNDNPIDNLAGLAAFKVPILHVISNSDKIVPNEENTYLLVQRYTALGGPATIYPVTDGPQTLEGHHFPIRKADEWADFILKNTYPIKKTLPNKDYFNIRNGLKNSFQAITGTKKATVAFLGGSITYNNKSWRTKTCTYLKEAFPETDFRFINAGIPSLGSLPHAFRLKRDLLDSGKIDLLFVEAAVNDRANGTDSLTQIQALEGIVRHAKTTNPNIDIVVMSFADPDKTQDYDNGKEPVEVKNHELVAEHYRLPSINLAKAVRDKIQHKEFSWAYDFKDLHPSAFGQELYFSAIKSLFLQCFSPSKLLKNNVVQADFLNKNSFTKGQYYPLENAQLQANWTLDKNWKPTDKLETRDGFVNVPMIVSTTPENELSLNFKGTAVGISIVSGPDAGIISYSVDNAPFKKLDLFTQWSNQLHLPWYLMLGAGLAQGEHVLKLRISPEKNPKSQGNACRIVHFLVN
jgi:sialidase-1